MIFRYDRIDINKKIKKFFSDLGYYFKGDDHIHYLKMSLNSIILGEKLEIIKNEDLLDFVKEIEFENKHVNKEDIFGNIKRKGEFLSFDINLYEKFIHITTNFYPRNVRPLIIEIKKKIELTNYSEHRDLMSYKNFCHRIKMYSDVYDEIKSELIKDAVNISEIKTIVKSLFFEKDNKILYCIDNMEFKENDIKEKDIYGDIKGEVQFGYIKNYLVFSGIIYLYEKFIVLSIKSYPVISKTFGFELKEKLDLSCYKETLYSELFEYREKLFLN